MVTIVEMQDVFLRYCQVYFSGFVNHISLFQWKGTGEFINTKFWCRVCALLHDPKVEEDHIAIPIIINIIIVIVIIIIIIIILVIIIIINTGGTSSGGSLI